VDAGSVLVLQKILSTCDTELISVMAGDVVLCYICICRSTVAWYAAAQSSAVTHRYCY